MPIGLIVFILYLVIMVFSRRLQQTRKSSGSIKKEIDSNNYNEMPFIPDRSKKIHVENNDLIIKVPDKSKNSIIDDEVEEMYQEKNIEKSKEITSEKKEDSYISEENGALLANFHDDIFVNGIIVSELLGLPRALNPHKRRSGYLVGK